MLDYEIGDDDSGRRCDRNSGRATRSFVLEGPNVFFKMTYKGKSGESGEVFAFLEERPNLFCI